MKSSVLLILVGAALAATPAEAQTRGELRAAARIETLRHDTPALYAFLRTMPKGGDLHSHLGGAVYAESFIRWAVEDGGCISLQTLALIPPPCTPITDTVVAAARVLGNQRLYDSLVDVLSMRNWNAARAAGHDHFFESFGHSSSLPRRVGDMVAEVAARAASGGVSYLELMQTFEGGSIRTLARRAGYHADWARMRDSLDALSLDRVVQQARARIDSIDARRDSVLHCRSAAPAPGCKVTVRWIYQVLRAAPPEAVFAQVLLGLRLAQADPRVVGVNLVQPEDAQLAMSDYSLHMRMIQMLRAAFPSVKVTLHAGELTMGLVPPEGLRFHIREAVEIAGAQRIGHGVDVMFEDRPDQLLAMLAQRKVMIEINLTSNDVILGVRGKDHPLKQYLAAGVPVALSTDDEGVSRSEMTMEYLRAVQDQGLGYLTLKRMARTSLEYSFVEGTSLWQDFGKLRPSAACGGLLGGMQSARCGAFLQVNTRARLQWELERDFTAFEGSLPARP